MKHPFEADPLTDGATCLLCGMQYQFGGLHVEAPDNAADGYEMPRVCQRCRHYEHSKGPCRVLVSTWPKPIACSCGEAA